MKKSKNLYSLNIVINRNVSLIFQCVVVNRLFVLLILVIPTSTNKSSYTIIPPNLGCSVDVDALWENQDGLAFIGLCICIGIWIIRCIVSNLLPILHPVCHSYRILVVADISNFNSEERGTLGIKDNGFGEKRSAVET